jgi:hypothetical protein
MEGERKAVIEDWGEGETGEPGEDQVSHMEM